MHKAVHRVSRWKVDVLLISIGDVPVADISIAVAIEA
jgi:hypothetical protein